MKRHKSYSFELHGIAPGALALEEWQQQVPGTARRTKVSLKPPSFTQLSTRLWCCLVPHIAHITGGNALLHKLASLAMCQLDGLGLSHSSQLARAVLPVPRGRR